ncbi:hypothetical protein PROFUN_12913 [Planoprotostelium fungivorum]|uniref:RING-type domain-containing protein n=1 Tax=Planoprotostelium fungivorum TaxID=1890364 RepID=A0A2P6N5Z3_9EUKA|nr:hypothetical protein PROFUN_12913 [Planoprotostelium fungivorum]
MSHGQDMFFFGVLRHHISQQLHQFEKQTPTTLVARQMIDLNQEDSIEEVISDFPHELNPCQLCLSNPSKSIQCTSCPYTVCRRCFGTQCPKEKKGAFPSTQKPWACPSCKSGCKCTLCTTKKKEQKTPKDESKEDNRKKKHVNEQNETLKTPMQTTPSSRPVRKKKQPPTSMLPRNEPEWADEEDDEYSVEEQSDEDGEHMEADTDNENSKPPPKRKPKPPSPEESESSSSSEEEVVLDKEGRSQRKKKQVINEPSWSDGGEDEEFAPSSEDESDMHIEGEGHPRPAPSTQRMNVQNPSPTTLPTSTIPKSTTPAPSISTQTPSLPPMSMSLPPMSVPLPPMSTTLPPMSTSLPSMSTSLPSMSTSTPLLPSILPQHLYPHYSNLTMPPIFSYPSDQMGTPHPYWSGMMSFAPFPMMIPPMMDTPAPPQVFDDLVKKAESVKAMFTIEDD